MEHLYLNLEAIRIRLPNDKAVKQFCEDRTRPTVALTRLKDVLRSGRSTAQLIGDLATRFGCEPAELILKVNPLSFTASTVSQRLAKVETWYKYHYTHLGPDEEDGLPIESTLRVTASGECTYEIERFDLRYKGSVHKEHGQNFFIVLYSTKEEPEFIAFRGALPTLGGFSEFQLAGLGVASDDEMVSTHGFLFKERIGRVEAAKKICAAKTRPWRVPLTLAQLKQHPEYK